MFEYLRRIRNFFSQPKEALELLSSGEGVQMERRTDGVLLFSWSEPVIIQQVMHPDQQGSYGELPLGWWAKVPEDRYLALVPVTAAWHEGVILPTVTFLEPGFRGELKITLMNVHPAEPALLPPGEYGVALYIFRSEARSTGLDVR
jgi:hypothetical protein